LKNVGSGERRLSREPIQGPSEMVIQRSGSQSSGNNVEVWKIGLGGMGMSFSCVSVAVLAL
jgi:hypothetical protein